MVRKDGYNIIIEMEAPPKTYGQTWRDLYDPSKDAQENWWIQHKATMDELTYDNHIQRIKYEITEFAKNVFAKDIAKDITKEAVKCVDEVVRQTLK